MKSSGEKLGLYHAEGRRTQNRIRDRIQEELQVRTKTIHELKNALNTDRKVVERNIEHLEDLGVVATLEKKGTTYWKLTNRNS